MQSTQMNLPMTCSQLFCSIDLRLIERLALTLIKESEALCRALRLLLARSGSGVPVCSPASCIPLALALSRPGFDLLSSSSAEQTCWRRNLQARGCLHGVRAMVARRWESHSAGKRDRFETSSLLPIVEDRCWWPLPL